MKEITEPSRVVPVIAETDVLVVGSGPGGLSAALASAREGVDTMLVERFGSFGGNITQCMVGTIAWYRSEATVDAGGAGVAAASAVKQGVSCRSVNLSKVQQALEKQGVRIA
ncbi:MAG: FAD-dependent oxidoreductase [Myxococcota bacterium]|nr:FAD-dependent oxidoreductase [Myxococcota bacterium]